MMPINYDIEHKKWQKREAEFAKLQAELQVLRAADVVPRKHMEKVERMLSKRIAELEAGWNDAVDKWKAERERIAELERIIADNCDPSDATKDDAKIIQECFYAAHPENL